MQLSQPLPADGALDPAEAATFLDQQTQGLAVEGIGGLELAEGEGRLGG